MRDLIGLACDSCKRRNYTTSKIFMYDSKIDLGKAGVAQLVEREPSKLGVAGSSPVSRST